MSFILTGTEESIARVVAKGFEAGYKRVLLAELKKMLEPELEKLAEDLAKQIVLATVSAECCPIDHEPKVTVEFKSIKSEG